MVDLIARTPCEGLLPLSIGGMTLEELTPPALTLVMPLSGQVQAVGEALGSPLPEAGESLRTGGAELAWFARNQYLLIGAPAPDLPAGVAAVTDQSDAWAMVRLSGAPLEQVLARLVPVDVSLRAFPEGAVRRTELKHMMACLLRSGPQGVTILVFRSMAQSLVHEIATAMEAVAARR